MFIRTKANLAAMLSGLMLALVGGAASSATFSYPYPAICSAITIATSGAITCSPVSTSQPVKFTFAGPISCSGLAVDVSGAVSCAATLPDKCTLTASSTAIAPGDTITLTASGCTPTPSTYGWAGSGLAGNSTTQNAITVTLPASVTAGPYPYSVTPMNADGAGAVAKTIVNVAVPGYTGPFAYIAHQLNAFPAPGTVSVVDTKTNLVTKSVPVGVYPVGVAVNPAGTRVYVTNAGNFTVSVINAASNEVVPVNDPDNPGKTVSYIYKGVGLAPWGIAVNPSGTSVYVANSGSDSVSVIDTASNTVTSIVSVGKTPYGVAVNPTGSRVYVTNYQGNNVSVIDAVTNKLDDKLTNPVPVGRNPYGIAVDPAGTRVYVANEGDNTVSVIDVATNSVIKTVKVGTSPRGVAVNPAGTQVYVVNNGDRTVSVIDPATYTVTTLSNMGSLPNFIAFNPEGTLAYVTNYQTGDVSLIDAAAANAAAAVPVGAAPYSFGRFVGPALPTTPPYLGLWWNEAESGWGMSITQHRNVRDMIFVAIYTYDQAGQPVWYTMPSCPVAASGCAGEIYKVSGGTSPAVPWNGAAKVVSPVGNGTLTFSDANNGTFDFTIEGLHGNKRIMRQLFGPVTTAPAIDYTDLWWNKNESGWGVALTHQYGKIFATWFSYDAAGKPMWYTASDCAVTGNGCTGDLYQVKGGSSLTAVWNGSGIVPTKVGSVTITFSDASNGSMSYSINGVTTTRSINRQEF
jgi:YVTN family beta-propeller protein